MAMREPRSRRNCSEGRVVKCAGEPSPFSKVISPLTWAAGGSSPMMASEVMDFPEPDSPTSPSTSPGAMENESARTAATAFDCKARSARGCGNSMVRSRTSSSGRTKSMVSALRLLLFWPRFRGHHPGHAVINYKLSIVFAGMLEQSPRHIGKSSLLILERIDDQIIQTFVTLLLDHRRAVGERLFYELDDRGFRLELIALRVLF